MLTLDTHVAIQIEEDKCFGHNQTPPLFIRVWLKFSLNANFWQL
jgi:hypothetical protein